MMNPSFLPPGTELVKQYAAQRGLSYLPWPKLEWFRTWEPFHMLSSPPRYYNSVGWNGPVQSAFTIAEPWMDEFGTPLDRTLFGFAKHPGIRGNASCKRGDSFVSRVAFLVDKPPNEVKLGDPNWDPHVETRSISPHQAALAFPPAARALLYDRHFYGHIEVRPGGLVCQLSNVPPNPEGYQRLAEALSGLCQALVGG